MSERLSFYRNKHNSFKSYRLLKPALFIIFLFRPKDTKKSQYAALEPDIEAALGEIDGVDLSELAEILGETAINR